MSTWKITVLCLLLSAWLVPATASDILYGRTIAAPEKPNFRLKASLDDLQQTLHAMTGKPFTIGQSYAGPGILLVRTNMPQAPADAVAKLKGRGREPFIIRGKDPVRLWIIANGDDGLSHGIFCYLEKLGCRWFMPNPHWTIIPGRGDITLRIEELVAPAFKQRSFAGTGGFGPLTPYDPQLTPGGMLAFQQRWYDWERRNRFGGEYALDGHAGEAFNVEKKAILLQHPEYQALVNGKPAPWSEGAKLNTGNPDAVKLYVEWSLERFRARRKSYPDSPYSVAVSVDPSDGGGHCACPDCRKIGNGSPSDQVFYVANQVARAIRREFPDGYVNLYAYNQHAAPPSFPIEPNVIVSIIPYAFQNTGMGPEEFIQAWGSKVPQLCLYDYWSITDWTWDEPSFNYLATPAEKLRFWHRNHIVGFNGETTYGAGAMGIGWYVASRLMWNPQTDTRAIIEDFYARAFGPATVPMRRLLERWARTFMLTSAEIGESYRDLREAMRFGEGNPAVQARLDDYGRYLHFLRLRLELGNAEGAKEREPIERALVEHLFDCYESNMMHSFRLYQFLVDYGRKRDLFTEFNNEDKAASGWGRIAPLTHGEIAALMADGARKYPPPDFQTIAYSGALVPLTPAPYRPLTGEEKWATKMPTNGAVDVEILAPAGVKSLPLRVSRYYSQDIAIIDSQRRPVFKHHTVGIKEYELFDDMEAPLPGPGRYTIQFRPHGGGFIFQTIRGVPLAMRSFLSEMGAPSPRLFFYVPRGLTRIAMYYPTGALGSTPVTIMNPEGTIVPLEMHDGGKLVTVPVAPGQDGKVWSLVNSRCPNWPHRMLNVPQCFAFSPDTLLVPKDAIR